MLKYIGKDLHSLHKYLSNLETPTWTYAFKSVFLLLYHNYSFISLVILWMCISPKGPCVDSMVFSSWHSWEPMYRHIGTFFLFFFFCSTRVWIQGLTLARKFYHLSHAPSLGSFFVHLWIIGLYFKMLLK
jgi:hypothetical protein